MGLFSSSSYSRKLSNYCLLLVLSIVLFPCLVGFVKMAEAAGNFYQEVDVTWGNGRGKIMENGNLLTLSLDKASGSGFQSKKQYLFGRFDMKIKLVPGNSAGTVTAYYLRSEGTSWDEIDFEFLGNLSGQPYIVHTNIYIQGQGNREQQFYLWFDPTADFHTYSFLWNPASIVFYVDGRPIREFKNMMESNGVPYPKKQAMRVYGSLWNGEDWATRGGLEKTDWTKAPFTASFSSYSPKGCVWTNNAASGCSQNSAPWLSEALHSGNRKVLRWVQKKYMIYNYCTDKNRFPQGLPPECTLPTNTNP